MSTKLRLSVVIPCYNEEVNIRLGALDKVARFLEKQKYQWEGIIVDDGSTDESKQLAKEFCLHNKKFQFLEKPHKGKAATVIAGMLATHGEYVLFMDLDQAVPVNEVNKLLPYFEKGYDVVIGSRKTKRRGAPFTRRIMARGFMMFRRLILNMPGIVDTQCGFKAFSSHAAQKIFTKLKLYSEMQKATGSRVTAGFDVELLFLAKKLGFHIREVEVPWYHVDTRRVNPIRDSLEGLRDLIRIKINDTKGVYR